MQGKVLKGKYAGLNIAIDEAKNILYVEIGKKKAKFIPRNVEKYDISPNFSRNGNTAYIVKWVDGMKSLISIPSSWVEIFISGCETGPVNDDDQLNLSPIRKFVLVLCLIMMFGVLAVFVCGLFLGSSQTNTQPTNIASSSSNGMIKNNLPWAKWDGTSAGMPSADIPVYVTEASGSKNGGNIVGVARNRTTKKLSYVQITFGVYSGETKVGTCFTNIAGLVVGEDWQFNAYCPIWPTNTPRYKIDDVAYW